MDEAKFIQMFGDRLIARLPHENPADLRRYAAQTAPSYYFDPEYRADGYDPAGCADTDLEYWD